MLGALGAQRQVKLQERTPGNRPRASPGPPVSASVPCTLDTEASGLFLLLFLGRALTTCHGEEH